MVQSGFFFLRKYNVAYYKSENEMMVLLLLYLLCDKNAIENVFEET